MRTLQPSDFGSDFKKNCIQLADALGVERLEDLPRRVFRLNSEDGTLYVPTRQGKIASAAFLYYCLAQSRDEEGQDVYAIRNSDEVKALASAFFAEYVHDPKGKHPVIDMLLGSWSCRCREIAAGDGPGTADPTYLNVCFENREHLGAEEKESCRLASEQLLTLLEHGAEHPIERDVDGKWEARPHVKPGILLYFRTHPSVLIESEKGGPAYDKIPLLWADWKEAEFEVRGFRAAVGARARVGTYIAPGAILMPSYVNIGASVGAGSLIDTWATVGSCAQIGENVHVSGGAGIGGVLEPIQAASVVIEDGVFIGARSEIAEGVIIRKHAVLSMGVFIGKNTPIVDRTKGGQITTGEVPENAVVMMGVHPTNDLICPQIVKYRDERTNASVALEEALRETSAIA